MKYRDRDRFNYSRGPLNSRADYKQKDDVPLMRGQARTIRSLLERLDESVPANLVEELRIADPRGVIDELWKRTASDPDGGPGRLRLLGHLHDSDADLADGSMTRHEERSIRRLLDRLGEPVPADIRELGVVDPQEYMEHLRHRLQPLDLDKHESQWINPLQDQSRPPDEEAAREEEEELFQYRPLRLERDK